MKFASLLVAFYMLASCCLGQPLQHVANCPSNEVYDMLLDKKGFIWVAHNLGVSRYDGLSFTSFNNPEETSISMTDLVEDNYGRIWCHNFNGQIFYIKDDKMVYLKGYDYKKEFSFPRMMLFGDELVATCHAGVFVCNTATLETHYCTVGAGDTMQAKATESMCVVNKKLLIYGYGSWYTYSKQAGLGRLGTNAVALPITKLSGLLLEPGVFGDTAYVLQRKGGLIYGITFFNGTIEQVLQKAENAYINSVNVENKSVFINTKALTYALAGTDSVMGYNLSSVLHDKEGNLWLGSLSRGLYVSYQTSAWKMIPGVTSANGDYIRWLCNAGQNFVVGNQSGRVSMVRSIGASAGKNEFVVPVGDGEIESLQKLGNNTFFISSSNKSYILNEQKKQLYTIGDFYAKDLVVYGRKAYGASAGGILIADLSGLGYTGGDVFFNNNFPASWLMPNKDYLLYNRDRGRCRALLFDSVTNSLLASFKDGLQQIKDGNMLPVLFNGKPLYVSSMVHCLGKIYAATFNSGLFVIDSGKAKQVGGTVESPTDAIVRIKRCGNHIWLFRTHDIELFDANSNQFLDIPPFPLDVSNVSDVEEDGHAIYWATYDGVYTIPYPVSNNMVKTDGVILYMLVNNRDTVLQSGASLPDNKNDLRLQLAIPAYKNATQLHFKYRLVNNGSNGNGSDIWYYTQDGERELHFNALKSGSYMVEAVAVINNRVVCNKPLVYYFTIEKPWYNTGWFYLSSLLLTVLVSIVLYKYRLRQLMKMERMRRKISNDLHDDIGSTLSSINVYSQLAKGNYGNEGYIDTIQHNVVSVINSLDDLVWNINPKNDTLGQLVGRMQLFSVPFLNEKGVACTFQARLSQASVVLLPDARANIYLLFKEIISNVSKHSAATGCAIYFIQKRNRIRLVVKDNGRGFNMQTTNQHRNGLRTMAERVNELNGEITIKTSLGAGTEIRVDCEL